MCLYVYVHVHVYVYVHVYKHVYMCMTCVSACMYVYAYVRFRICRSTVKRDGEGSGVVKAQVLYNNMLHVLMTSTKLFLLAFDSSPS